MAHRTLAVLGALALGALAACPAEDEDSTCSLTVSLSGDFAAKTDGSSSLACVTTLGSSAGFYVQYIATSGDLKRVELQVEDVMKGQTGSDFAASVDLEHSDGRKWKASDCRVTVAANTMVGSDDLGDSYQVAGSGTCTSPAADSAGSSTVTVAPFEFRVEYSWAR